MNQALSSTSLKCYNLPLTESTKYFSMSFSLYPLVSNSKFLT